ncbi:Site-specific recombinase XerD [Pseudomonas antarctica]|uniref:Site-specific recombinase XerD n=1 Tax=Pseudomonas antarctica TaxID=219572 RepID=A0A1H0CDD1_9PSED|nr:tyrosine-type recombinase/integrase [Pseudomonas antarctica]KAF2405909.1 tyrosine recombinase XerD [Pseudomonas antarctica]SDN55885.1 Site-specific recombinase XerD [Pseudomonas antarctica]
MGSTASYELVLHRYPSVEEWLQLLGNLGRAPATLDAYGRGLAHYLLYCEAVGLEAESVTFEQVTLYIRRLLPGQENAVANSTLHQRLTAIRLWYDHLAFQGLCQQNPVPRGQHTRRLPVPGHSGFVRGLVPRFFKLPDIPSDEQWRNFLTLAAKSSIRDRLMLSLAYCGALRRAELVALRIEDLDVAHRLISVRAETTKGRRSRIVCYSPDIAPVLMAHLHALRQAGWSKGALFRSESDRNRGSGLTRWTWSKTVETWAKQANISSLSTHTFRHLRLTHLARAGWKLHELTAYAGHRDPKTTLIYLHLSGADLTAKMARSVGSLDARMFGELFQVDSPS